MRCTHNHYTYQEITDPEITFIIANNADPNEMLHTNAAVFHLGLLSLPKYPFTALQYFVLFDLMIYVPVNNFSVM